MLEGRSFRFAGRTNASVPTRSLPAPSLLGYGDLLAGILNNFIRLVGWVYADAVVFSNENHTERAILQHSRELSFTVPNRQGVCGIIPVQRDCRVGALLVVVGVVLVFVEGEVAVCARINP